MARRFDDNREHSFQRIGKNIKEDAIGNVVFLHGIEQYLVNWSVDELVKKYVNPATITMDLNVLNLEGGTIDKVVEACETSPMFSERKVVIIKNYRNEFKEDLSSYLENVPEYTLLIITGDTIDKTLAKKGDEYNFEPLEQKQLISFMNKRFKEGNKVASRGIINMIITESGYYNKDVDYTLYNLDSDLVKIIGHCDTEEIAPGDVLAGVSANLEHGIFTMMDAISNNKKSEAFRLLNDLILSGENEFKLLGTIVSQLELMVEVKELMEDGKQLSEIQKTLKVHEFRVKKAMNFAKRYQIKSLKRALGNAYSVDGKIKTGLLDGKLALEMVIAEM